MSDSWSQCSSSSPSSAETSFSKAGAPASPARGAALAHRRCSTVTQVPTVSRRSSTAVPPAMRPGLRRRTSSTPTYYSAPPTPSAIRASPSLSSAPGPDAPERAQKPRFDARRASSELANVHGYVSFQSIEGLGGPPGGADDVVDGQDKDSEPEGGKRRRWWWSLHP